jgi:hypothetical protein
MTITVGDYINNETNEISHLFVKLNDGIYTSLCGYTFCYKMNSVSNAPKHRICASCTKRTQTKERFNEVMIYIRGYKMQYDGCSPSIRQIMKATSYSSISSVKYALERLEQQGKIKFAFVGKSRQIMVIGGKWTCNNT